MRVKLKPNKQRKLIYEAKNSKSLTWKELADELNTSVSSLIEWKSEKNLLPLRIFKKLDEQKKYKKFVIEFKKENWGRSKGGQNSKGNTKIIFFPKKNIELAELCGIILGDGNINRIRKGKKISVNQIRIAGHSIRDRKYLTRFIKPLLESLFKIKAREYTAKNALCHYIIMDSIELVKFFNSLGLKSGNKIRNNQGIPKWILKKKAYLKVCIKGLIDTDGCIHRMSKRDNKLLRINFKNNDSRLFQDVFNSFKLLGYNPHLGAQNQMFLSRQEEIKKYILDIGFSNQKHLNRLKEFQRR